MAQRVLDLTSEQCIQQAAWLTYRQESVDNISLNGAQWFVLNDHKNLFFFLQINEVTKPGFFGKPDVAKKKEMIQNIEHYFLDTTQIEKKKYFKTAQEIIGNTPVVVLLQQAAHRVYENPTHLVKIV